MSAGNNRKRTLGTDNRVLTLCRLLNRHRVKYLLAGGVAANLHGSVRATRDVDILVPRDLKNMSRLHSALCELPYGVASELDPADMMEKTVTIIGDDPRVDVLTVAWTVRFEHAYPSRRVRRIQGVRVPYLNRKYLIKSKQTGRPQDQADLDTLGRQRK